jgi:hypothetical protein
MGDGVRLGRPGGSRGGRAGPVAAATFEVRRVFAAVADETGEADERDVGAGLPAAADGALADFEGLAVCGDEDGTIKGVLHAGQWTCLP